MLGIEIMKRLGGGGSSGVVDVRSAIIKTTTFEAWKIDADGFSYKRRIDDTYLLRYSWITPQVGMSLYEVRATWESGEVPAEGTLGVWQSLGTDRIWGFNDNNEHIALINIEIRLASTGSIVDTATVRWSEGIDI